VAHALVRAASRLFSTLGFRVAQRVGTIADVCPESTGGKTAGVTELRFFVPPAVSAAGSFSLSL